MTSPAALRDHVALAAAVGISGREAEELLVLLSPYVGYPFANDAVEEIRRFRKSVATPRKKVGWLGALRPELWVSVVVNDARDAAVAAATLFGITTWRVFHSTNSSVELRMAGVTVNGSR